MGISQIAGAQWLASNLSSAFVCVCACQRTESCAVYLSQLLERCAKNEKACVTLSKIESVPKLAPNKHLLCHQMKIFPPSL